MNTQERLGTINEQLGQTIEKSMALQRERALLLNLQFPVLRDDGQIVWVSAKEFYGLA